MTALLLCAALLMQDAAATRPSGPEDDAVRASIGRGVAFLLREQNADGSWGGPRNKTFTDSFANPETHHAWTVGTTGLDVMALLECAAGPEAEAAIGRGLDYLIANCDLKRPAHWDNDNVWGSIYGLSGVARALAVPRTSEGPRASALRAAGARFVAGLSKHQSPNGGWGYYADPESAWRPEWATSFTTAAGVLALLAAKDAGIPIDARSLRKAVLAVARCQLPSGAMTYDVMAIPRVRGLEDINQVKGSLGRIQICNLALHRAEKNVAEARRSRAVQLFREHHRFLDCALRKPIPHESWYYNAAYFYLFGHYYASLLTETLPADQQQAMWPFLQREVMKTQESDGGMWDFYISSHTKAYGTAFGIMSLARSLKPST